MSKRQVKIKWPFKEGEKAQLIWIGEPFRQDNKIMFNAYFRSQNETKGILMDWGTLPCLAIQHYYVDGIITANQPPDGVFEADITIHPNGVQYYEKPWSIQGSKDSAVSRSFVFSFNQKRIILPVIEVVRSILAPNGFLLYRLFESNSFPQFFTEIYEANKIHLSFSAQYEKKYTQTAFVYQLVWLLTNSDLRQVFEIISFTWLQEQALKFDWRFTKAITVTARVKEVNNNWTVMQIIKVKDKHMPYDNIFISHPEIRDREKSNEAKKATYRKLNRTGSGDEEFTLDEQAEGTTEDFDLVQMNQLKHEYTAMPKVERIKGKAIQQRTKEDENTKNYYINNDSIRSTADIGGQQLARGLEHEMLHEIQAQGELKDFINVLKIMEQSPQVKLIRAFIDTLPDGLGERKFTKLSDGITKRRYVIAEVYMADGRRFNILEVERENRALSMLILLSSIHDLKIIYNYLLTNLVNDSGTWTRKSLEYVEHQGISLMKAKHSGKGIQHRAEALLKKLSF